MTKSITSVMKTFQLEMKKRMRIPKYVVDTYKDDIYFMMETDITCMEVVQPRVMFVESLGYEVTKKTIDGYVKEILKSDLNENSDRWVTTEERLTDAQQLQLSKEAKKKVEPVMKKTPKDTHMYKEEIT